MLREVVDPVLLMFGVGYLAANLRLLVDGIRFLERRSRALLIWSEYRSPYRGLELVLAVVLGVVLLVEFAYLGRRLPQLFGEGMMFLYYACAVPLSRYVGRGLYEDGVWAETGFMPYKSIGGIAWREGKEPTLVLVSSVRRLARRLVVPGRHYAAVRRLLRDRIAANDIHFSGSTSLSLGMHDEKEDV